MLDLSRNGGGLLENSVDIAGFFIKEGGVVAVKDTFSKVQIMRDRDSKIAWEGPMVVLTSRVSASASEIVGWRHEGLPAGGDRRRRSHLRKGNGTEHGLTCPRDSAPSR